MAGKRVADTYLTHDNWDNEDQNDESPGIFQQAEEDVLKKRVIKKARRRAINTENKMQGTGAFSNFGGLKATANNDDADFKKKFSFLTNGTKLPESAPKPDPMVSMQETKKAESTPISQPTVSEFHRHLAALNKSVCEWITKHVKENPMCDLSPVFRDYRKHFNSIEEKYGSSQSSESSQEIDSQDKSAFKLTGFDKPPTTTNTKINVATPPPVEKPVFGGFNTTAATTATPFKGFDLGPKKDSSNGQGFSFSSSMVTAAKKEEKQEPESSEKASEDAEEVAEQPIKSSTIEEEGAIYTKRCKLFYKKGSGYCERGVGIIYLKKVEDKTQLLVRADTTIGTIMLNIVLQSSTPAKRLGKNNVMLTCIPNPPIEKEEETMTVMLIRVKTGDDADELLKLIEENKGSS